MYKKFIVQAIVGLLYRSKLIMVTFT